MDSNLTDDMWWSGEGSYGALPIVCLFIFIWLVGYFSSDFPVSHPAETLPLQIGCLDLIIGPPLLAALPVLHFQSEACRNDINTFAVNRLKHVMNVANVLQ